jgi:hypothetical protein
MLKALLLSDELFAKRIKNKISPLLKKAFRVKR